MELEPRDAGFFLPNGISLTLLFPLFVPSHKKEEVPLHSKGTHAQVMRTAREHEGFCYQEATQGTKRDPCKNRTESSTAMVLIHPPTEAEY